MTRQKCSLVNMLNRSIHLKLKIIHIKYSLLGLLAVAIAVLYLKQFYSFIFLTLFIFLGILLSIIFRNNSHQSVERFAANLNPKILSVLFFLSISLLLLSLLLGTNIKTIPFYLLLSLCASILGTEIICQNNNNNNNILLFKIYILCLIVFLSNQIVFPLGIGGADSYKHLSTIQGIVDGGYILPEYVYSFTPLHHLLISISSEISLLNYKILYYILGAFVMSLCTLVLYLIGKTFISERVGLLSALIYPYNDYILFWSSHPAQLTYLMPLMCFLFWAFLLKSKKNSVGYSIIALTLIIAIIFSHHYSSFIIFLILISFLISDSFINKKYKLANNIYIGLILFLIVSLFSHWVFYSNLINTFSEIIDNYFTTLVGLIKLDSSYIAPSSDYDRISLNLIFLNTIGSSLLLMLSSYIFFDLFRKPSHFRYVTTIWMLCTFSLIGLGVFFHFQWLLPNRLYVFLQLFCLIFLASQALNQLSNLNRKFIILYLLMIFSIVFFSSASTIAGFETSLFKGDQPYVKLYETPQELTAENWVESHIPPGIIMYPSRSLYPPDMYLVWAKESIHLLEEIPIYTTNNTINISAIYRGSFILFSMYDMQIGLPYYWGTGFWGGGGVIKLSNNNYNKLDSYKGLDLIYNTKIITVYYMAGEHQAKHKNTENLRARRIKPV